jgi:hypothetical protein
MSPEMKKPAEAGPLKTKPAEAGDLSNHNAGTVLEGNASATRQAPRQYLLSAGQPILPPILNASAIKALAPQLAGAHLHQPAIQLAGQLIRHPEIIFAMVNPLALRGSFNNLTEETHLNLL